MPKYLEIFKYFITLGFTAFGGPAAHIAMMEKDLVKDKKWMSRQEFLDYLGITNLIPGPNSTELTMHCGYHRGGIPGLILAGVSFIFPAVLLTGLVAYIFFRYEDLTVMEKIAQGFKVTVLIIILDACRRLFKKAAKSNYLIVLSIISAVAYWFFRNEIIILIVVMLFTIMRYYSFRNLHFSFIPFFFFFNNADESASLLSIFFSFLKVGCILFGSGYVLFAYLDTIFVQELGLLSPQDLLDAIAIGQFTPGPILSTSTFIGYQLGGWSGAGWATLGIFLPAFIFVMVTSPWVKYIRKNLLLSDILDAVNAVSFSFIGVVAITLIEKAIIDWQSLVVLALTAILFLKWKVSTIYLLLIGALTYLILG